MSDNFEVVWRGNPVGEIQEAMTDMWYLDGLWVSNESEEARLFENLVSGFDPKKVWDDPTAGTRILIKEVSKETDGTNALLLSLNDGKLSIRQVFMKDAVEWLLTNVS